MTPVLEKTAKKIAVARDTELQRPAVTAHGQGSSEVDDTPCGQDRGPEGAEVIRTFYLLADFNDLDGVPEEIAGHRVVRSLDPAKWPHFPDAGCQKEWDELDK